MNSFLIQFNRSTTDTTTAVNKTKKCTKRIYASCGSPYRLRERKRPLSILK